MVTEAELEFLKGRQEELAGVLLTPAVARLYSQFTRVTASQPSLPSWTEREAADRLDEALRLLNIGLSLRLADDPAYAAALRRSAEILEWLADPGVMNAPAQTLLWCAAAYQIAGYPARASGVLRRAGDLQDESKALRLLVRPDLPSLFHHLIDWWADRIDDFEDDNDLGQLVAASLMRSLGVLAASARWPSERRTSAAIQKLRDSGALLRYDTDDHAWLTVKTCAEVADAYSTRLLRWHLESLASGMSTEGMEAIERYVRANYLEGKVLLWPSQIRGLDQLKSGKSFALCTPTGSGKTTIAEVALLQSLFNSEDDEMEAPPLAIYLVPSRALATEVEAKLARVLGKVGQQVIVTGLYGGTDWGPTDAWLTATDPAVLVCTFEKGEALIRFLGPTFLDRVRLLVVDEAHMVQFDGQFESLKVAENRSLRLESLVSRLLAAREDTRAIALSAVASGFENSLARWITGVPSATATASSYRSTRQLIGRLLCNRDGRTEIRYDALDSASLEFPDAGRAETPYIRDPFPPCPGIDEWIDEGPEKRLRPFVFWAATQLAAAPARSQRRSVLISITQQIGGLAEDFLRLLDDWGNELPPFFEPPEDEVQIDLWSRCLGACEDYFGKGSREYKLLERGIIMHHGKMPGLLARLLVEAIDQRLVHIVMATSTLSEGVNLPFEVVLIPTLRRGQSILTAREFSNLIGRAGRPGVSTEGRALIVQEVPFSTSHQYHAEQARIAYFGLLQDLHLEKESAEPSVSDTPESPLATLIEQVRRQWTEAFGEGSLGFESWLEETAPLDVTIVDDAEPAGSAVLNLDALDSILISAITELVPESDVEKPTEVENRLRRLWTRTYAHVASAHESDLEQILVRRGLSLVERIYPRADSRQSFYATSLPPRAARDLLQLYERVSSHLEIGQNYAVWDPAQRFDFIAELVELINEVPRFELAEKAGRTKISWRSVLRWWLDQSDAEEAPSSRQVSDWHNYVSQNFTYRFNWAIGGLTATALRNIHGNAVEASSLDDWPKTGLPWVTVWLKELITWGTLEPVAAYLLARRQRWTRTDAEASAHAYYDSSDMSGDQLLDPRLIRDWALQQIIVHETESMRDVPSSIPAKLLREFPDSAPQEYRVLPVIRDDTIIWMDPAGFALASSTNASEIRAEDVDTFDFVLSHLANAITVSPYLAPPSGS